MSLSPIHVWAMGERPAVCSDFVMIEVGNHLFKVPREMILSVEMHESEIRQLYKKCHIRQLQAVGFSEGGLSIYDGQGKRTKTTYDLHRKVIENLSKDVITLKDGLKKIDGGNTIFYFLPKGVAPTDNEQPVTIVCSGKDAEREPRILFNSCHVMYIHPNGIMVEYRFSKRVPGRDALSSERSIYSDDEIIALHERMIRRVEEMIVSTSENVSSEEGK